MRYTAIYLRVSTYNQNSGLEAQQRAILEFCKTRGIENLQIYSDEGISGAKASRPGLDRLMGDVRSNKVGQVVVYSFSRFARSLKHLLIALDSFRDAGVDFVSVTESLDTSTPVGRTVFSIIASIAELERELIKERVVNGLKNAKAKGKRLGAIKKFNDTLIRELYSKSMSKAEIAKLIGCSRVTVHRALSSTLTTISEG